jgi:diadenosine tetraphosphate (Ap4A) HIT family hydrolase
MKSELTEQQKQIIYRDARFNKEYDDIWRAVGKCVFCDLNDKYVFFEENGIVMTISLYAYIDGHFLILPKRHVRSTKELTQLEWDTIRKFSYIAQKLIRQIHNIKGMQLIQKAGISAQGTVSDHIHFHCVPFDKPDLCVWNFRKLKYTPLENVALYRKAREKIIDYETKYDKKYQNASALPVVCDLAMINTKQEVLLQERQSTLKFIPDTYSLPGGLVESFNVPLEIELAREVKEETSFDIKQRPVRLLASRLSKLKMIRYDKHLRVRYPIQRQFIWNTYLLTGLDPQLKLQPGDDCLKLFWQPLTKINNSRISPGIQQVLKGLQYEL